jgi:hypothetical protein
LKGRFDVTANEPSEDIGLILWGLKRQPDGAAATRTIAVRVPKYVTVNRTREILEQAQDRGLVREVAPDWWEITEAREVFPRREA